MHAHIVPSNRGRLRRIHSPGGHLYRAEALEHRVLLRDDAGDTIATAYDTGVGPTPSAALCVDPVLGDGSFGNKDVDFYKFQGARGASTWIRAYMDTVEDLPLLVRIFRSTSSGPVELLNALPGANNILKFNLPADDTYYVGVSSPNSTAYDPTAGGSSVSADDTHIGGYDFELITFGDMPDTMSDVPNLGDSSLYANSVGDGPFGDRDVDFYRVDLPSCTRLTLAPVAESIPIVLRIFDTAGHQLRHPTASLTEYLSRAGTYYIGVSGEGNTTYDPRIGGSGTGGTTGWYFLRYSTYGFDPEGNTASSVADALGPQAGTLLIDQSIDPRDVDLFEITAFAGARLEARTDILAGSSAPMDTVLRLFDSVGNQLEIDDNGGTGLYSFIHHTFAVSGTYYIGVSGYNNSAYNIIDGSGAVNGSTGAYSLRIDLTESGDVGDGLLSGAVTSLGPSSGAYRTRESIGNGPFAFADVDVYQFQASPGQVFHARTSQPLGLGKDIDTVLRLFNAAGNELVINNDASDGDKYSKLDYTFTTAGTYYIGVSAAGNASYQPATGTGAVEGEWGDYDLSLTLEGSDAQIHGVKYHDRNGNGLQDFGEEPLAGWTVYIDSNHNGQCDTGEPTCVTDASGAYAFTGLVAGDYDVREVLQPDWTQSAPSGSPVYLVVRDTDPLTGATSFGGHIAIISSSGQFLGTIESSEFAAGVISDVEVGPDGKIYVAQDTSSSLVDTSGVGRILVFDSLTSPPTIITVPEDSTGLLFSPFGFDVAGDGTLYVAQPFYHRILHLDASGAVLTEIAQSGTPVDVAVNGANRVVADASNGDRGTTLRTDNGYWVARNLEATLYNASGTMLRDIPGDSAVDVQEAADGSVYISHSGSHTLDRYDASGNILWSLPVDGFPAGLAAVDGEMKVLDVTAPSWIIRLQLGFESGNLNGWTTIGNATVVNASFPLPAPEGSCQALLSARNGATRDELSTELPWLVDGIERNVFVPVAGGSFITTSVTTLEPYAYGYIDFRLLTDDNSTTPGRGVYLRVLRSDSTVQWAMAWGGWDATDPADAAAGYAFQSAPMQSQWLFERPDIYTIIIGVVDVEFNGSVDHSAVLVDNLQVKKAGAYTVAPSRSNFVRLAPGQVLSGIDFGNHLAQPTSISGVVFDDRDGNGAKSTAEPGIAGRRVYLDLNTNDAFDAGEPVRTTDANGGYTFDNVSPDTYVVRELLAIDWTCTAPTGAEKTMTLDLGDVLTLNFANSRARGVSNTLWEDSNTDGVRQLYEGPLGAVLVKLYDPVDGIIGNGNDVIVDSLTTPADGFFAFMPPAGSYYLELSPPPLLQFTALHAGSDAAKDSDVDPATGRSALFMVGVTGTSVAPTAGLYLSSTITGSAMADRFILSADSTFLRLERTAPADLAANYAIIVSAITSLVFDTREDDDELIINFAVNNPIPAGGLTYIGGAQSTALGDRLALSGGTTGSYFPSAVTPGSGTVTVDGREIHFSGLEPVRITQFSTFTFVAPGSVDTLQIGGTTDAARIAGHSAGGAFESLEIATVPDVTLDLNGASPDVLTIDHTTLGGVGPALWRVGSADSLSQLIFNGGHVTVDPALLTSPSQGLWVDGTAILDINQSLTIADLSINGSARVNLLTSGKVLKTSALTVSPNALLDIGGNNLILQSSPADRHDALAMVAGLIGASRNANPQWRKGLGSSVAAADTTAHTGPAVFLDDDGAGKAIWATFAGMAVDTNCILVRNAPNGDTDLNGKIDAADYARINAGFLSHGVKTGYRNGDFTCDGQINIDDYNLMDKVFLARKPVAAAAAPRRVVTRLQRGVSMAAAPKPKEPVISNTTTSAMLLTYAPFFAIARATPRIEAGLLLLPTEQPDRQHRGRTGVPLGDTGSVDVLR